MREQLRGIPQFTYGGTRHHTADLYIPEDDVDAYALVDLLRYIQHCELPFDDDYDKFSTPQMTGYFTTAAITKDIKFMCETYQAYMVLGMHEGQLAQQEQLVENIKAYFSSDRLTSADAVLHFWRTCKEDAVLTWRVLWQVLTCVTKCSLDLEQAFGRCFEQEVEMRHLWEVLLEHKKKL